MLQAIRERASGWIAYVIVALLIIPFALWGINSYFGEPLVVDVAEVGDSTITQRDFQQAYQQRLRSLQNMLGDNFDSGLIDETALKNEVLQRLVDEKVLLETARQQGMLIGDMQLNQAVRSYEAFQKDGRFDGELYQRLLYAQGFTPVGFEQSLRGSLVSGQLQLGVAGSALLTDVELNRMLRLLKQKREFSYIVLPLADYRNKVELKDAAIAEYFEQNKDRFLSPEQVQVHYLELKLQDIADSIDVSEQDIAAAYEEQKARFVEPEKRSASHILFKAALDADEQTAETARRRAQELYESIAAGEQGFDQALAEVESADDKSVEAGELGMIPQGMFDSAFDDTLYQLPEAGAVSEPVRTPFGYHIIRVDEIIPASGKPLEEVHDELERELRTRRAEPLFYEAAETLTNLSFEHPDSLEAAAEALSMEVQHSGWLTRDASEGIAAYPEVVQAAFSEEVLGQGYNSEPLEVEPNHVIVLRVAEHKQAAPLSMDEARPQITEVLQGEKAQELLAADIAALQKRVEQGEDLTALAEAFAGELHTPGLVERTQAEIPSAVLTQAFALSPPAANQAAVGAAVLASGDRAVIRVDEVQPGDETQVDDAERNALRQRLSQQSGAAEFQAYLAARRGQMDIVTYNDKL